jgi:hypothetical protein
METYRPKFNWISVPAVSEQDAYAKLLKLMKERPDLFLVGAVSSAAPKNRSILSRLILG